MKKFIKHISIILVVFIGITTIISAVSLWALRKSSFYKPSFLVNSVKKTEFDYIVIGASTGLTTLNTKIIDSLTHLSGLNLSMDDTALSTQYLMLQHFLYEGKKTNYCIIAPSVNDYDVKFDVLSGNDYRFLMYIQRPYVSSYFKEFNTRPAQLMYQSRWMPSLGVSYYNAEVFFPSILSLASPSKRNRFDDKGNFVYPPSKNRDETIKNRRQLTIQFQNDYLKRIKNLCETHNIQLICYLTPMENTEAYTTTKEYTIINHTALLNNHKYFYDTIHVDALGREIASDQFAQDFMKLMN